MSMTFPRGESPRPRAESPRAAAAAEYAPIIQLSRGERYEPCSVDWYASQCRVVGPGGVLATAPTPAQLAGLPTDAWFEPLRPKAVRPGGVDPTLYTRVVSGGYGASKFVDYWYHVFFAYNGTLSPHDTDVEYVIVRVFDSASPRRDSAKKRMVFMSGHAGGRWHDAAALEHRDGRVVAYAALDSHAFFPGPGTRHRVLGLGSDRVVAGGKAYAGLPLVDAESVWGGRRARGDTQLFPPWFVERMGLGLSVPDYSLPLVKRAVGARGLAALGACCCLAVYATREYRGALAGVLAGVLAAVALTDDLRTF